MYCFWCQDLSDLRDLILLEQFKNSVPPRIATCVTESKASSAYDTAVLADQFALMHKNHSEHELLTGIRREPDCFAYKSGEVPDFSGGRSFRLPGKTELDACNYCQAKGHWKSECPRLKAKA